MLQAILLGTLLIGGAAAFYRAAVRRGESRVQAAVFALLLGPFAFPLLWRERPGPRSGGEQRGGNERSSRTP